MIAALESIAGNVLAGSLLDAVPAPAFLFDEEARIVGFNSAAARVTEGPHGKTDAEQEIMDCIWAPRDAPSCGRANVCDGCFVRNLVTAAFSGRNAARQKAVVRLITSAGARVIQAHVTATLLTHDHCQRVLVVVESPIDLTPTTRLVPICAKCKRIRDERERWSTLEHYLCNSFGVRFTHGLCPECLSNSLAEVGLEFDPE
jgi:predicted Fe-S protein YdhL (DUF1289 family)